MKKLLFLTLLLSLGIFWMGCETTDPEPADTNITLFKITNPFQAVGVIDETAKTIDVEYPYGEDISAVTVEATIPAGATITPSNPVNFSGGSVVFTVDNEGSTSDYTVHMIEGENPLRLVLLGDAASVDGLDPEMQEAYNWALGEYAERASYIPFSDLGTTDISTATVMWFHYTVFPRMEDTNGDDFFEAFEVLPASSIDASSTVADFVKSGGNIILTGLTGSYVAEIGRILPEYGPTNYDTGGDEFIENPDCWGISFLPAVFNANDYPANNDNHFLFKDVERTSYTFEGVTYDGICLSTGGAKKNRAHIWDFNRFFEGEVLPGCDDPNAKKTEYEARTNSLVRASFEWDPAACGVELGAIVEYPAHGDFQGDAVVIGLGAYEWEMKDGRDTPSSVVSLTQNAIDNYID